MPRIRTVKPEFFTNFNLYKAEAETELPLRLSFEGLWIHSDREGRFKWIPEELKIGILPYDNVDFSRVLDALWTRGFVEKYAVNGVEYGVIPSFSDHQVINNKERDSILPIPNENNILTREERVTDARTTRDVRKGKERKGKELCADVCLEIINYLNELADKNYKATESQIKFIEARLNEGFTSDDIKNVIAAKCEEWLGTEHEKYLRPETLFNATKFSSYHGGLSSGSKEVVYQ